MQLFTCNAVDMHEHEKHDDTDESACITVPVSKSNNCDREPLKHKEDLSDMHLPLQSNQKTTNTISKSMSPPHSESEQKLANTNSRSMSLPHSESEQKLANNNSRSMSPPHSESEQKLDNTNDRSMSPPHSESEQKLDNTNSRSMWPEQSLANTCLRLPAPFPTPSYYLPPYLPTQPPYFNQQSSPYSYQQSAFSTPPRSATFRPFSAFQSPHFHSLQSTEPSFTASLFSTDMHASDFLPNQQSSPSFSSSCPSPELSTNIISTSMTVLNEDDTFSPSSKTDQSHLHSPNTDHYMASPNLTDHADHEPVETSSNQTNNYCESCKLKDKEIYVLEQRLAKYEDSTNQQIVGTEKAYKAKTRPNLDFASYVLVANGETPPAGFQLLAPGARIAVQPSWLSSILSSLGQQRFKKQKRAEKKGREVRENQSSEILKRLTDGFFEPSELAVPGGSKSFKGNPVFESLKCYAIHLLKMNIVEFTKAWNEKMGSCRQTISR